MSKTQKIIAGIKLRADRPTTLTFRELRQWVIWQFPETQKKGLCGAVHPPIAGHEWIPAVILIEKKSVQVYAHLDQMFPSPETALEYLMIESL